MSRANSSSPADDAATNIVISALRTAERAGEPPGALARTISGELSDEQLTPEEVIASLAMIAAKAVAHYAKSAHLYPEVAIRDIADPFNPMDGLDLSP